MLNSQKEQLEKFEETCKFYCNYHKVGEIETIRICGNLGVFVNKLLTQKDEEKIEEYRKGYNNCLKEFKIKNDYGEKSL